MTGVELDIRLQRERQARIDGLQRAEVSRIAQKASALAADVAEPDTCQRHAAMLNLVASCILPKATHWFESRPGLRVIVCDSCALEIAGLASRFGAFHIRVRKL